MIDWRLKRQLDNARSRLRQKQWLQTSVLVWLGGALLAIAAWGCHRWLGVAVPYAPWGLAVAAVAICVVSVIRQRVRTGDDRLVARRIEMRFPDLQAGLLSALDVKPPVGFTRLGYLEERVLGQVLSHAYQHGWWQVVSTRRLLQLHAVHLAALLLFVGGVFLLSRVETQRVARELALAEEAQGAAGAFVVRIEPGNTEVERGSSLLVTARFDGPLPPDVSLSYEAAAGDGKSTPPGETPTGETSGSGRVKMTKALNDPLFGGAISSVTQPTTYVVTYAGQRSEVFRVDVFEYPQLVRADAQLVFPDYTGQSEKLVQDVRHVTAVVGTRVTLRCYLNKKVASAQFVEKKGETIDLREADPLALMYELAFVLDRSRRGELKLLDEKGRENKDTVEFVFTAVPNNPPDLKLAAPGRDLEVSPLEEIDLKAKVFDDFGLQRVGLQYVLGDSTERELILAEQVSGQQRLEVDQLVALENLQAEPDQLLSYYFWAEDVGPDGQTRRVSSDMYFAEVRPFEEIFREGQPPPSGQSPPSGNARQADELAQLEKEIINATWNVIRRESITKPSAQFPADVELLRESQQKARERVEELAQELEDPQSLRHVQEVTRHMDQAVRQLSDARDKGSAEILREALSSEQLAYQSLLKLRAREHQVVRAQQNRSAGGGSSSSRSQQQLQQLDLQDRENRYETERTAQPQQDAAEQEMREVLNRLRELARRQSDLNERLKELQAELQQAETDEERDEINRRLKRLQEEQEQILRDTDELQARMQQPQNAEPLAESRQQLQDARERVRQTSEALREGMVPQAVSSGSRAEQDFEDLREQLRKQTSDHFRQAVRRLQEDAQQLETQEQELAQDIQELTSPEKGSTSLRDTGNREQLVEQLGQQQEKMNELLEKMRSTIQEAEQPQPLLADQLYDAARTAQQRDIGRGLEMTRELLRRGFDQQAQQQEVPIGQAISELRSGIDRAAESILEDDDEALRRAQQELRELNQQLQGELAQEGVGPPMEQPAAEQLAEEKPAEETSPGDGLRDLAQERSPASRAPGQPNGEPSPGEPSPGSPTPSELASSSSEKSSPNGQQSGSPTDTPSPSENQTAQSNAGSATGGENGGAPESTDPSRSPLPRDGNRQPSGTDQRGGITAGGGNQRLLRPFGGEDFRVWADRLRDVEEMLSDPDLSAEAARIRERARAIRAESQRHSAPPNWDLVKLQVSEPLVELLNRVSQEVLKSRNTDQLVPIDRDPVPPEYADEVRRYFERLGAGQ